MEREAPEEILAIKEYIESHGYRIITQNFSDRWEINAFTKDRCGRHPAGYTVAITGTKVEITKRSWRRVDVKRHRAQLFTILSLADPDCLDKIMETIGA